MKRWDGLIALFLMAAITALAMSTRFRPSELERRHRMIRVGMTVEEVHRTMGNLEPSRLRDPAPRGVTWEYLPPRRFLVSDVRLKVHFDNDARVIRTSGGIHETLAGPVRLARDRRS